MIPAAPVSLDPIPPQSLRHLLATLAYRGAKVLRDAPAGFADFQAGSGTRTPLEILAHVGDLLEWATATAGGRDVPQPSPTREWNHALRRFFDGLGALDKVLAAGSIACPPERLLQGPLADALTHIGQLALLRRLAGSPVRGESYFRAEIVAGRLGPDQAPPVRELG